MNIGKVAEISGLSRRTIRYYEDIELVAPIRTSNGYRHYSMQQVTELIFLKNARALCFEIQECRRLLEISRSEPSDLGIITEIIRQKLQELKAEIQAISAKQLLLENLLQNERSDEDNANNFINKMIEKSNTPELSAC